MPFDFYIPSKNVLIEYDGRQHYEAIEYFGGEEELNWIKYKDAIKTKYCLDNNIPLLRLPYWLSDEEIRDAIRKFIT
jgi:hypothetical protein